MKKSLQIPRAKTTSDVSSAIQMLGELVRKYEERRDKKYDNDLKLKRLRDILPKPIEQHLVLVNKDGSLTHESVKRRASNWINVDHDGGQFRDSSGDLMGLREERENKDRAGTMDTATAVEIPQRIASRQQQRASTVDSGDMWQSRAMKKGKESKESNPKHERVGRVGPD